VGDGHNIYFPWAICLLVMVVRVNARNFVAIAIYEYDAESDLHLTFPQGAIIRDIKFWQGGYWKGKICGKVGFFVR
jgi:hypothetical protein